MRKASEKNHAVAAEQLLRLQKEEASGRAEEALRCD
jgi:hypothetical protein